MRKTYQIRVFLLKKGLQNRSFALIPQPSFLSLMKEKKAKENQGLCRGRGSKPGTCRSPQTRRVRGIYGSWELKTGHKKRTPPPEGSVPKTHKYSSCRMSGSLSYRSTTTRPARVRACTLASYMAAQRMAGRTNEPAYEACKRTRNVFVSPLFRSK